jgi:putative salt-induced outer membrane protein
LQQGNFIMTKKIFIIAFFLVSIPQMALSDGYKFEAAKKSALSDNDMKKTWKGEGEFGFTQTSGNTDTQNLIGKLGINYLKQRWEHKFNIDSLRTEDRNNLTAESYGLEFQSNYKWSKKQYWFNRIKYEDDRFSGYDYQTSISTGYGFNVFETKTTSLSLDIGVGFRQSQLIGAADAEQEPIAVASIDYSRKISDNTTFTQDFSIDAGSENIHSEANTGLKVSITDTIAMKLSYSLKNNSEVPAGIEKTDTISAVTLVYDF